MRVKSWKDVTIQGVVPFRDGSRMQSDKCLDYRLDERCPFCATQSEATERNACSEALSGLSCRTGYWWIVDHWCHIYQPIVLMKAPECIM